jgi:hypothetical protein
VDNLWITIAFHNAEWISWAVLERERGGWCIIGVLENENEIDLHLQIVTKAVMNPQLAIPLILTRIAYNRLLWRFLIYP